MLDKLPCVYLETFTYAPDNELNLSIARYRCRSRMNETPCEQKLVQTLEKPPEKEICYFFVVTYLIYD